MTEYALKCNEEKLKEALPPNLAPKLRVSISLLQEQSISLQRVQEEEWRGDVKETFDIVAAHLATTQGVLQKGKALIREAEKDGEGNGQ